MQRRESVAENALNEGTRAVVDAMLPNVFSPKFDPDLRERWYRVMCATPPEGVAAASRALAGRLDSFPLLPQIKVPTLVLAGEEDILIPVRLSKELQQAIPNAQWKTVPGGHACLWEKPEPFNQAFLDFVRSASR